MSERKREKESLERWLIDAKPLPLESVLASEDWGWDREDKTPSQPPQTPVLKRLRVRGLGQ